jgi:hypothetical protein
MPTSGENSTVRFEWPHGGRQVLLAGSFDGWQTQQLMPKIDHAFVLKLKLPEGVYEYKFIVDDVWAYDGDKPTRDDGHGNINNYLSVKLEKTESGRGTKSKTIAATSRDPDAGYISDTESEGESPEQTTISPMATNQAGESPSTPAATELTTDKSNQKKKKGKKDKHKQRSCVIA